VGGRKDDEGMKQRPPCAQSCGRLAAWMVMWGPPGMGSARLKMCATCAQKFKKQGKVRALKPREY
jgi:hypothetical protein